MGMELGAGQTLLPAGMNPGFTASSLGFCDLAETHVSLSPNCFFSRPFLVA